MKKILNQLAIPYVVLTMLFINKIIKTEIGMVAYSTITILFMFYHLQINKKVKSNH